MAILVLPSLTDMINTSAAGVGSVEAFFMTIMPYALILAVVYYIYQSTQATRGVRQ
jgi:hypothetical protein